MQKFAQLAGIAAPLPMINVDTDKIIPGPYLRTIARTGLGKGLFEELRYRSDGSENPDFVLNKRAYRGATILVTGENFGCGSSREHAPWALLDFGIRCMIGPSFADIFYNNCFKNGMLPIRLPRETVEELMVEAGKGENARFTVDLAAQTITTPEGRVITFDIEEFRKYCLLNGLSDIGMTLQKRAQIETFERQHHKSQPWLVNVIDR
jgi:3-isopropylmalate/(R)-2-methylmalate dehydratase small subunit